MRIKRIREYQCACDIYFEYLMSTENNVVMVTGFRSILFKNQSDWASHKDLHFLNKRDWFFLTEISLLTCNSNCVVTSTSGGIYWRNLLNISAQIKLNRGHANRKWLLLSTSPHVQHSWFSNALLNLSISVQEMKDKIWSQVEDVKSDGGATTDEDSMTQSGRRR